MVPKLSPKRPQIFLCMSPNCPQKCLQIVHNLSQKHSPMVPKTFPSHPQHVHKSSFECPQKVPNCPQKCLKVVYNLSPKYPQMVLKTFPSRSQNVPKSSSECEQNVSKSSPKCPETPYRNVLKVYLKCPQMVPKTSLEKLVPNIRGPKALSNGDLMEFSRLRSFKSSAAASSSFHFFSFKGKGERERFLFHVYSFLSVKLLSNCSGPYSMYIL